MCVVGGAFDVPRAPRSRPTNSRSRRLHSHSAPRKLRVFGDEFQSLHCILFGTSSATRDHHRALPSFRGEREAAAALSRFLCLRKLLSHSHLRQSVTTRDRSLRFVAFAGRNTALSPKCSDALVAVPLSPHRLVAVLSRVAEHSQAGKFCRSIEICARRTSSRRR